MPPSDGPSRREVLAATAATLTVAALATPGGPSAHAAAGPLSAARHLVTRLRGLGVDHLFGVAGATCDALFAAAEELGTTIVACASDLEAGYAADGYARMRGLSLVSVSYGVGTASLLGVVAGAYAERVPIVVVNGGPTPEDLQLQRDHHTYYSHSCGRPNADLALFREVTAYAGRPESAADVPRVVEEALAVALREQRPVYLEIPKQLWFTPVGAPATTRPPGPPPSGQEDALAAEVLAALQSARRPTLLLGVELARYGLADDAAALVRRLRIPWATTLLGRAVLPEDDPHYLGTYAGQRSVPALAARFADSDVVLALGAVLGRQYRSLATSPTTKLLHAADHALRTGSTSRPAALGPLLRALAAAPYTPQEAHTAGFTPAGATFDARRGPPRPGPAGEAGLTYDEVMREVSGALAPGWVAVTDTSLSMYPAGELVVPGPGAFVCNGVWQSIGFSVAAAVGVAASGRGRPLVVCGDGGFQMTAQALSTLARYRHDAVVLVLDNGAYGIEQLLLDPKYFTGGAPLKPYLALPRWDYAALAKAMGVPHAATVTDVAGLRAALAAAQAAAGPTLVACTIRPHDLPAGLT